MDNVNEIELVTLSDDVMTLCRVASNIETIVGKGQLSEDLRHLADKLNELIARH